MQAHHTNWSLPMDKTKSEETPKKGSGNFKDDPARAAEAGRKGGQSSGKGAKGDKAKSGKSK